jgi:beta-lactamase superfamily II metal-dependent hydrolase
MAGQNVFDIHMFPASEGDCFLVEWGDLQCPQRILIDGGRSRTYEKHLKPILKGLPKEQKRLRLLVITHVDRDHIEGVLDLIRDRQLVLSVDEVWFNDYHNLLSDDPPRAAAGAAAGERLTRALRRLGWPRNTAFGGGAVSTGKFGEPITRLLGGGMEVTLLSPDRTRLERMAPVWLRECARVGLEPGEEDEEIQAPPRPTLGSQELPSLNELAARKTPTDTAAPNGSSIAFLLEYRKRRVLFAADAHPDLMLDAIEKLGFGPRTPLEIDAFKLPHHGSNANTTQALLDTVRCPRFLISTNGTYFGHPNIEALARVITASNLPRTLYFNYPSEEARVVDRDDWRTGYSFETKFGTGNEALTISIPLGDAGVDADCLTPQQRGSGT